MAPPDIPAEATGDLIPDNLAEAGVYPTAAAGFDRGLVVLAMGQSYCLVPSDAGYRLLVEPPALEAVREQLACYERESVGWPPRPAAEDLPARSIGLFASLVWALVVLAVFCCQDEWPGRLEAAGALDTQAVFDQGEWWRLGTALFLHADLGHLVSNLFSGIFVFAVVRSTIGRWRGWLLLAIASVAGNFAIAGLNYPGPYRSIGASTAVFAGLGLLTGRAISVLRRTHRWRALFVAVAAGLTLLGLYGAGGTHTDVGAHATGFAAGLVLGFAAALPRNTGGAAGRTN
jgi:membrane associated rhomboid family serine protease